MAGFMNYDAYPSGDQAPAVTPEMFLQPTDREDSETMLRTESHLQVQWPEERPSARMNLIGWIKDYYVRFRFDHKGWNWFSWLKSIFPILAVLETYNFRKWLLTDILSGCTVAAMLVPQGLSYAKLAGVPSVFGLYGGFVPLIVYAFLGTCRQLGVGPVAVTSLLLGSGLPDTIDAPVQSNPNSPADPAAQMEYNKAAIQVAFLAGLLYTAVGLLNLGWLTNFLSHAVISGFMTGACVIIGLGQVKYIFGYNTHPVKTNSTNLTNITKNVSKILNLTNLTNATKGNLTNSSNLTNVIKNVTNATKNATNATKNATNATKKVATVSFPRSDPIQDQLADLFSEEWLPYWKWREFAMGACWIVFILGLRKICSYNKHTKIIGYFGPLLVVIISTALTYSYRWDLPPAAIRITGAIPSGLPGPTVSWFFPMENFGAKILLAVIVCLIDMLESISIARAMAMLNGYELNPTAEIRGLGVANILGSCFNCYTTTGSFSRSSLTNSTGAKSQLAGLVTALCIMLVLLWLTPLFKYLPLNAMAAIIIAAMPPLFNYKEFLFLWRVNKFDCLVFTTAFLCVLFLGVELGLAISIGVSLLIIILYSAFPQITILGNVPGTEVYRSVREFEEAEELSEYLIVRIDAPIYFANLNPIRTTLDYYSRRAAAFGRDIKYLVIDLSGVPVVDGPAIHFLKSLVEEQHKRGVQLILVQPSKQVVAILMRSGLDELIGREFIGMNLHQLIMESRGKLEPTVMKDDISSWDDQGLKGQRDYPDYPDGASSSSNSVDPDVEATVPQSYDLGSTPSPRRFEPNAQPDSVQWY